MNELPENRPRVIVVDDEAIVLSLVRDALEDEDYIVEAVSSSLGALELLNQQQFDLIITDIRMPKLDGIEMVKRARELHPDIGVIFMTGYANLSSAKNAIKQGAFDYIMKPFELSEIRQAVRNAIKSRTDAVEKSSNQQLSHLSDLSQLLFTANDHDSMITSSLRFAMLHQRTNRGSILHWSRDNHVCTAISITGSETTKVILPDAPLCNALVGRDVNLLRSPFLVDPDGQHPILDDHATAELRPYFYPAWLKTGSHMVVVPIIRFDTITGWTMLGFDEETIHFKESDAKFLTIAASQLAIMLENLSLLEQTQRAYASLKELQDETIELEKMATRGQMSAEIGHELNNFLGIVAGNLSLLEVQMKRGHYEELPRYVTPMTETIEKIKTFTNSLMDLRQISSRVEVLSFDKILQEVVDYLKPQKRFQGVEIISCEIPKNIPFEGDSIQIQQLLYNLFNNAADASIDRPVRRITVEVTHSPETDRFTLIISDTGVGFAPEYIDRAFQEKFTTKETGHGFGLVVCKRIIENHKGQLHVDSIPNQGASIRIDFPVAAQQAVLV